MNDTNTEKKTHTVTIPIQCGLISTEGKMALITPSTMETNAII